MRPSVETDRRSRSRGLGPAILVGLLAFLLTVEWRVQNRASEQLAGRRAQLVRILETRQRRAAELEARLGELRKQVDALSGSTDPTLVGLRRASEQLGELSGTVAVTGPGLLVTLTDASGTAVGDADSRIQDVDVQGVVNALWAAGAEGIAVNGQRIVGTTAIRNAGSALLVNYRVLSSPYRISAVGEPHTLNARFISSPIAGRFRAWKEIYGLGFTVGMRERLSLPAYRGGIRFRYAEPLPDRSRPTID